MSPALAQEKELYLVQPIDCSINENCWFMNYVDVDPDTGVARDFTCNRRSYEGHKGTDIAIRSMLEFERGIDVHAAAAGTILRFRDGEEDRFKSREEMKEIREARKECGNGIIIDHGAGWLTQYCHLKKGSIKVKEGDKVYAGQDIAQVGMSGITEHPHIHLSVLHEGKHIDPFTGHKKDSGCKNGNGKSLWKSKKLKYEPFSLYDSGFTQGQPDFDAISQGSRGMPPEKESDVLFFWMAYLGAKSGDQIEMVVLDPSGQVILEHNQTQKAPKARQYYYVGKRKPDSGWSLGTYQALIKVRRDGVPEQVMKKALDIY